MSTLSMLLVRHHPVLATVSHPTGLPDLPFLMVCLGLRGRSWPVFVPACLLNLAPLSHLFCSTPTTTGEGQNSSVMYTYATSAATQITGISRICMPCHADRTQQVSRSDGARDRAEGSS